MILLSPYIFLTLSMLFLLVKEGKAIGKVFLFMALTTALIQSRLEYISFAITFTYMGSFIALKKWGHKKSISFVLWVFILALSLALSSHYLPGFNNLKILDSVKVSEDTIPYSLWLNFDKPLIAVAFLWFFNVKKNILEFPKTVKLLLITTGLAVLTLMIFSYFLNFVRLDLKWPKFMLVWTFKVLFLTCFAEECFFRGILWKALKKIINNEYLILLITSLAFGAIHYPGGLEYVFLSSIAGGFYGFSYLKTKRIGAPILVHFFVNLIHIIFFSYPALQKL